MRRARLISVSLVGALAMLAASRFAPAPLALARLLILGGALGLLAVSDVQEHRIPNVIVLPATLLCAALSLAEGLHPSAGLDVAAVLVVLLMILSLAVPRALGMGDVKLALLILCALDGFAALALMLAFELYALLGLALHVRRGRAALGMAVPLAPVFAAACIVAAVLR